VSIAGLIIRVAVVVIFFVLLFLSQRFWYRSLWQETDRWKSVILRRVARSLAVALLVFLIFSLVDRMLIGILPRGGLFSFLFAVTQLWLVSSLLAYVFFKLVIALGWAWFGIKNLVSPPRPAEPENSERRVFLRHAAQLTAAVPLVAAVYGFSTQRFGFRVLRTEVPIPGLPPGLDGLQIVQLSDIHMGDFMPREEVRRAVDMANSLGAHLAVVTGDFITGENDPLEACVEELQRLRAPLGVFSCNGNHEIYAHAEDLVERLFMQHGMRLLRQQCIELEWQGGRLNLIGVDYQRDRMVRGPKRPMLEGVESLVRRDMPNVLLSHNPNSFYKAAELGIELTLAGHTHGGQVQVEIVDKRWNPARFITPFIAGLYRLPLGSGAGASSSTLANASRQAFLYVNRGLGTIGVPARLAVDPEITLLTLRRA
jgi:hypothetical protein